ncbi:MAG: phytoene desaturase [Lewinellaceae bacterium]|nr:phytoene desaturase [Saprospiraceae bacterium]MCB9337599.1 phytoene desaturase [Lewinellaceae bacterium]
MNGVLKVSDQLTGQAKNISIIGSGLAGLAASIRLAAQGHRVTVFEANSEAGGKMYEWHKDGFRFDMGPSVFTMPQYVEDLFHLTGRNPKDYIEILRPELPFNYFFEDGLCLNFYADTERLVREMATKTNDDEATIRRYLADIALKYDLTEEVFLKNSLHSLSTYLTRDAFRGVVNFHKVEVFHSMDEANRRNFRDDRTRRLFNAFASYLGSSPYKAPGVLNVISHFQLNAGIYLPVGGMYAIVKALTKLAGELGVEIRYNSPVERILTQNGKATGLVVNSQERYSDLVVSNLDAYNTYHHLMPQEKAPRVFLDRQKSHSALVFHWGMKKQFPQLAFHNMVLSEDMRDEYNTVFNNADIGDDITIYLYISSKIHQPDAPAGCENWYILINAPYLQGQDWQAITERTRHNIIRRMSKVLGENIEPHIAFERVQNPHHFEQRTGAAFGSIYGNSYNGTFSVFLRHPNFSHRIKNLFFCGGTVHPGAGVPLSFLSAKIVSDMVSKKTGSRKGSDAELPV